MTQETPVFIFPDKLQSLAKDEAILDLLRVAYKRISEEGATGMYPVDKLEGFVLKGRPIDEAKPVYRTGGSSYVHVSAQGLTGVVQNYDIVRLKK